MQNNEELVDTLNELVRINYDRIFGYERAIEDVETEDVDLKTVFSEYADQSRKYVTQWQESIRSIGGEPATDSTVRGKLFRVWMDFKATITAKSRQSILDSCEFGEDAAQRQYQNVLESDTHLPDDIRQKIAEQKSELKSAHDSIRDAAKLHEKID